MTFQCPSCDKTLKHNAKLCECGWELKPSAGSEKSSLIAHSLDHQCTWNDHGDRCKYPVNFFEPGQTRSFCRYHKKHQADREMCAKILARSLRDTQQEYDTRSNAETYGTGRSRFEQQVWEQLYANRGQA